MTRERDTARILWLSTALLAVLTSGCCYLPMSAKPRAAQPLPESLAATYSYVKGEKPQFKRQGVTAKSRYSIHRIELSATNAPLPANRNIVFDYYEPGRSGKHPVILVLPIFGGVKYPLENHFASYFARHGLAAVIVHREKFSKDSVSAERIDEALKQTVLDNKRVIDWMETQDDLDTTRLGVFGASMGAIKGALLTPLDSRVRTAVLGLAGGDLPYIVTYSTEKGLSRHRAAYLLEHPMSLQELQEKLRKGITCDPNTFAPYLDPRKVFLVLAAFDTVVPVKKGLELRKRMGNPETIVVPAGHYTAALFLPYIKGQTIRFFRKKFSESAFLSPPR